MDKKIILASASPRRRDILTQVGIDFAIDVSDCEEIITEKEPDRIVMQLSSDKALSVAKRHDKDSVIIGADTVVAVDGKILGKPKDFEDAFDMIKSIQGKSHSVYTGVTILYRDTKICFAEESKVYVYDMTDDEIVAYIETGDGEGKAGSYAIQGVFAKYIKKIDGDYYNIVGLPVARIIHEIGGLK